MILVFIGVQIYTTPRTLVEYKNMKTKKVIRALFVVSRMISYADVILGYIISLIRGKQILKILDTKEFRAIDCNTTKVNKILILVTIIIIIVGCSSSITVNKKLKEEKDVEFIGVYINGTSTYQNFILILLKTSTKYALI